MKLPLAHRLRRDRVDGSIVAFVHQRLGQGVHQVVQVDPAQSLSAIAQNPAQAKSIGRLHHPQGAAIGLEHQPHTKARHAHPMCAGAERRGLPTLTEVRQEPLSWRRTLIHLFLSQRPCSNLS